MALDEKLVNLADLKAAIDSIPKSDADMTKAVYDTNNNGIVDNAEKVNGHTVNTDVPSNAKFTDTVYDDTALAGRVSTIEGKESGWDAKQNAISDLAAIRSGAALGATALQSFTETDPTVPSWAKQSTKPTYTASEVGALPDTTVIPTVPTAEISANTAARHTHTNKTVIDGITAEDISKWNSGGDVSEYIKGVDPTSAEQVQVSYEVQSNKVTSMNELSTDIQYPSAKAVYTALNNFAKIQGRTITINGVSIDIPNFEDGRGIAY